MEIVKLINQHIETVEKLKDGQMQNIAKIARICNDAIASGHKILLCGNGGSAADSQHIAAEFVGRFYRERVSLPAIALTTDTSILTAVANDYDYVDIFRRQVEGLGNMGDVLIGITTSGNSANVVKALEIAKEKGMHTIAFTGSKDSKASQISEVTLYVPSTETARIQECHILAGHLICQFADEQY